LSDSLNNRNTESVKQQLRDMDDRLRKMQEQVNGLNNLMSVLQERMTQVEQVSNALRVRFLGNGPTVK
jgi:prefoldin subunit 5